LSWLIIDVQQRPLKTGKEMEALYKNIRQLEAQLAENRSLDADERVR
jgi:BMFP domain-containing protein YqiC